MISSPGIRVWERQGSSLSTAGATHVETNDRTVVQLTEEQTVVSSILRAFPEDIAAGIEGVGPTSSRIMIPLIRDLLDDGTVVYDERHQYKRPDWTFDS